MMLLGFPSSFFELQRLQRGWFEFSFNCIWERRQPRALGRKRVAPRSTRGCGGVQQRWMDGRRRCSCLYPPANPRNMSCQSIVLEQTLLREPIKLPVRRFCQHAGIKSPLWPHLLIISPCHWYAPGSKSFPAVNESREIRQSLHQLCDTGR